MVKLNKDFFKGNEVLFIGYSARNNRFSNEIYQAFTRGGIKVYPVNNKPNGSYDIKVYNSLSDLPKVPETAFVLLNKENARKAVNQLADSGVKRILFQGKKNVDDELLSDCSKMGIEVAVGCPMMVFGSGLHKIHAFFAGVR